MSPFRGSISICNGARVSRVSIGLAMLAAALVIGSTGQASDSPSEQAPISYSSPEVDDPVSRLQKRLDRGEARLTHDRRHGYLKSVLELLDVPVSSQGLVYSKTSFQRDRIAPETPRAVYFGDAVYVGWVQWGEVVEISTVDPQKGAIFYTLSQENDDQPRFIRQTHNCLQCHDSSLTQSVPGHLVRSVYSDHRGQPILSAGSFVTGHQSPLRERWGGWYVTGTHGSQRHMGNLVIRNKEHRLRPETVDLEPGANREELAELCDTTPYLSPHSDLVALMVLEHQTQMHNLLTRANYQTRLALRDEETMNRALGRDPDQQLDSTRSRIRSAGEPVVRYLLFCDEAALGEPVNGTSDFARDFSRRGPRDSEGRSLREFDLERRMFRYPCSYLIYSEAFESQPAPLKEYVYRRLLEILRGEDKSKPFEKLSPEDRTAILEILLATKTDLPDEWRRSRTGEPVPASSE
jgi:hypothetical protein